jgi:hypothetical protein
MSAETLLAITLIVIIVLGFAIATAWITRQSGPHSHGGIAAPTMGPHLSDFW